MLEVKTYTKPELTELLGTKAVQGLKNKLNRYHVDYDVSGKGEKAIFTIKRINDPFKVYCITELGYDANTDFSKLAFFYYYFFNDEEFMAMPDEVKEFRMTNNRKHVSRQTIAKYTQKLESLNLIDRNTENYTYYFAYEHQQIFTDKPTYCKAWREYWERVDGGMYRMDAIDLMRIEYGGVARKQAIPQFNGIYNEQIETISTLATHYIMTDLLSRI